MNHLIIGLIHVYQRLVSPFLPASCVFTPTCSHYALQAFGKHGFWRALWMTSRRLARCWPWSHGGLDPVP